MKPKHLTKMETGAIDRFVSEVGARESGNLVSMKLFGSRARREGDEGSDIDILVLLKRCDSKTKNAIWDIANDLFLDTWVNISPLVITEDNFKRSLRLERRIAKEIEEQGITL